MLRFCGGDSAANIARTQTNSIRSISNFEAQLPVVPSLNAAPLPSTPLQPPPHAATTSIAAATTASGDDADDVMYDNIYDDVLLDDLVPQVG